MTDEKLVNLMQDARLIAACDNIIFPVLELMISHKIEEACAQFRGGKDAFTAHIAYITAVKDLAQDLKSKQLQGNSAVKKLHERMESDNEGYTS